MPPVFEIRNVKTPQPEDEHVSQARVSKGALQIMIVILIAMFLLALYANVQKLRRPQIEEVRTTSYPAPSR